MSFNTLGLSPALLKAIDKKGYSNPSPIQSQAIPLILDRKDVLASAQTGTGKTAAFTLPVLQILQKTAQKGKRRPIRALVLTPTRELAAQVHDNVRDYGEFLNLRSAVIFGGVNQNPQVSALRRGVDILIATPGRLLDLHTQGHLSLADLDILIFDEADRMLDMGFLRDIKRILHIVPEERQTLLFSATFSSDILRLAKDISHEPEWVETAPKNSTAKKVHQRFFFVDRSQKPAMLCQMIQDGNWSQVLVFTRTKHGANRLAQRMAKRGITAAAIHGNKSQSARTQALAKFKSNDIRVLVATDIAARGLDIPLLPHVINFELPNIAEDYVHRIGRTGRAGAAGEAISLFSHDEEPLVRKIEKLLGKRHKIEVKEGFEPSEEAPPPPADRSIHRGGGGGGRGGNNRNRRRRPNGNSGGGNGNGGGNRSRSRRSSSSRRQPQK
ncbi:DEAD/DEAH box helicase [Pontibacter sp. G13]|uniref:DEAD/DEAH box helicase n=1 Tax=Pontibacter sp. G13 TaxID=3074898 RepID=UPI002889999B|nr:DEAD/DEAH box helicase [Pontibacter sp. G13]WNJ18444.1 DEAD/DEAH box helicase [Pontibacter sp. G13]